MKWRGAFGLSMFWNASKREERHGAKTFGVSECAGPTPAVRHLLILVLIFSITILYRLSPGGSQSPIYSLDIRIRKLMRVM